MGYDVTIGIPVYRAENYIKQTMESALAQTYPSIEFLVADDASDDSSIDIVNELQATHPRGKDIHIVSNPHNLGASETRNSIIDEAKGEYLYFLDSDDIISNETIALLVKHIKEENAEIAFGSYEKIEQNGNRSVYQYPELHFKDGDDFAIFAYRKYAGIQASCCNYLVKLSVLRNCGLRFHQSKFWEDTVFTLELATHIQRAVLLPDITYSYLCRENSLSDIQEKEQIAKEDIIQYLNTVAYLKEDKKRLKNKAYYPNRCYVAVMSDLYIICNVLKRGKHVNPRFTNTELKSYLNHPATLQGILTFRQMRMQNLVLYLLSKMPASVSIFIIRLFAKKKGLL